jgi:hypothetical protein
MHKPSMIPPPLPSWYSFGRGWARDLNGHGNPLWKIVPLAVLCAVIVAAMLAGQTPSEMVASLR